MNLLKILILQISVFFLLSSSVGAEETPRQVWNKECLDKIKLTLKKESQMDFNQGKEVWCKFFIDKTGGVTGVKISRTSGEEKIDSTAMRLIEKSAPFKPFEFYGKYKTGAMAYFGKDDIRISFHDPNKMPANYDDLKLYIEQWFDNASTRIKNSGMKKVDNKWVKAYRFAKPVYCTFRVGVNGAAENITVSTSSGEETIDDSAVEMIKRASPFGMVSVSTLSGATVQVAFDHGDVILSFAKKEE